MPTEIEKYQQAWKKFQERIVSLRKKRLGILANILNNFDEQKLASLRKKLK